MESYYALLQKSQKENYYELLQKAQKENINIVSLYIAYVFASHIEPQKLNSQQFNKCCAMISDLYLTYDELTIISIVLAIKELAKERQSFDFDKYNDRSIVYGKATYYL